MALRGRISAVLLAIAGLAATACSLCSVGTGRTTRSANLRGSRRLDLIDTVGDLGLVDADDLRAVVDDPVSRLELEMGLVAFPFVLQALFAIFYNFKVVNNFPKFGPQPGGFDPLVWQGPTADSAKLQAQMAPCAMIQARCWNCCLACCCPQARAAHTFSKTKTFKNYWLGCLAMFWCPFCTLFFTNACSDLNRKLGAENDQHPITAALCIGCCACCTIAQDAESLDLATGVRTTPCAVRLVEGEPPVQVRMAMEFY